MVLLRALFIMFFGGLAAPEKYNMSSLKILFSGAAPLGEGLSLAVHARLLSLGADVMLPQGL
jgi:4-coumarate--CoA ligase